MNHKTPNSDPVTKQDLLTALNEFSTIIRRELRRDLRKDFRKDIKEEIAALEIRTDVKLEKMELRMDDRAQKYRNEILTRFDMWASELENARQDRVVSMKQTHELRGAVDDHEKRIKKLEKSHN